MTVHNISTRADWDRAMADPDASVVQFVALVAGPLTYTGRNGSPDHPVRIKALGDGGILCPSHEPALYIHPSTRYLSIEDVVR